MSGIGALRERIALLHPVRTPDGGGGHEIAYEARGTAWASAEDRGSVPSRLGVRRARRRFVVRAGTAVLYETRIRHEGETFRVTAIRAARGPHPHQIIDTEAV